MPRLDREQAVSVAALALLLLSCVYVVGLLLQVRADAVSEASERREMLSRLEAKFQTISSRPATAAPPTAFLDARPRASQAPSCSHIWRSWPANRTPVSCRLGEKPQNATMCRTRFAFRRPST
jgi:hypothetical protein